MVAGGSQGGAAALAVTGLVPGLAGALIDVPFLTHIRRAVEITDTGPYGELTRYFAGARGRIDTALHTLDHFDGLNFAARASAPALFGTALRDDVVPPSTGFAALPPLRGREGAEGVAVQRPRGGRRRAAGSRNSLRARAVRLSGTRLPGGTPQTAPSRCSSASWSRCSKAIPRAAAASTSKVS